MVRRGLFLAFVAAVMLSALIAPASLAAGDNAICAVYFTGDGCPHCAKAWPTVENALLSNPEFVILKYEVYTNAQNAPVIQQYSSQYGMQAGIPLMIFGPGDYLQGDSDIISGLDGRLSSLGPNGCPLPDGSSVSYDYLNLSSLPGKAELVTGSGSTSGGSGGTEIELTFPKIASLAAVDAINPCAFAVLLMLLLAILTNNPNKKHKVLLSGLTFVASIFIIYFIYGLLIVKFFQLIQALASVKFYIYKAFAIAAIVLGALNIRDYFSYSPGRAGTEMPLMFRPKVRKFLMRVTSPAGAFAAGAFVALFLLPCTIGPYIIAGGILSELGFLATFPWLLFYNALFVLPMVVITLVVWGGISRVEDLSDWKDRNIRLIHLAAGLIMLVLGLAMLVGLI